MKGSLILAVTICLRFGLAAENTDSATIHDFENRVASYVHLRGSVESNLAPLGATSSQEKISVEQHNLADALRQARKNAAEGDIFAPPVAAEFRRLIGMALRSDGKRIRASLRHAEPVQLQLHVNDIWPSNVPLQSTPPGLLANLPRLPRQMEYRVTRHDLVLLDAKADLVVDLIENAIQ